MGPTHYDVLGIGRDASHAEVKRAYHARARATHPDQNPNAHESLFVLIRRAYDVLSDPTERARYDAHLSAAAGGPRSTEPPAPAARDRPTPAAGRFHPDHGQAPPPPPRPEPPSGPAHPARSSQQPSERHWPRSGVLAGGVGVAVLVAYAFLPTTREAFGDILWVQLAGLAVATWLAVRGVPIGAYVIAGLHLAFVVTAVLLGAFAGHVDQAWMIVLQSLALGGFVFGAVAVRGRFKATVRASPEAMNAPPQFGAPGHTWRRLGCLGWVLAFAVASSVAVVPAALISEPLIRLTHMDVGTATAVRFGALLGALVACLWLTSWAYRRITRQPAFWCQSCGVQTDPRFRICRACGRVKAAAR